MGFLTTQDRIGNVSHSSGIITLQPSLLTIGGQQYRTPTLNVALSGLTANTLYMVYVVMTGPTSFQLVVSGNYNSVGPAGYTKWKLVGAFYSNGLASVAFGSFTGDIYQEIRTDAIPYVATVTANSGALTNYTVSAFFSRNADKFSGYGSLVFTGSPGTWTYPRISSPAGVTLSPPSATLNIYIGEVQYVKTGSNRYAGKLFIAPSYIETEAYAAANGGASVISNTFPLTFAATDLFMWTVENIPVSAWSTTPIAYL